MSKAGTEILVPKGSVHTASTYVFIAPLQSTRAKAKMISPHQFNRERISIRWMDRYQKYRITMRPDNSVIEAILRKTRYPDLDHIISQLYDANYLKLH